MKSYKLLSKLLLTILIVVGLTACFDEPDNIYNGPAKVAWKFPHENSPLIINQDTTINLLAELIAHQRDHDLTFKVSVVDTTNSAAEISTPYVLPAKSVTISANTSVSDPFHVKIMASKVKKDATVPILIKLHNSNGVIADKNIGITRITIVGTHK